MQSRRSYLLVLGVLAVVVFLNANWWGTRSTPPKKQTGQPAAVEPRDADEARNELGVTPSPFAAEEPRLQGAVFAFPQRTPVAGAIILWAGAGHVLSGNDGSFRLPEKAGAPRRIRVVHPDHVTTTFVLGPPTAGGVELLLLPARSFKGMVVDAQSGEPLERARLTVGDPEGEVLAGAVTDAAGLVELPVPEQTVNLARGSSAQVILQRARCMIRAAVQGYQPYKKGLAVTAFGAMEKPVLIRLEPQASRKGQVLTPAGDPVPNAHVSWTWRVRRGLASSKEWHETTCDEHGEFEWSGPAIAWGTVVVASATGFAPGWAHFQLPDLRAGCDLDVTLSEAASFSGRIVDEDGRGVDRVALKVFRKDPPACWNNVEFLIALYGQANLFTAKTDELGAFTITGMPAGDYYVRWKHRDFAAVRDGEDVVTVPRERSWEGAIEEGAGITGVVVSPAGEPVPTAKVFLRVYDEALSIPWRPVAANHISYDGQGMFVAFGLERAPHRISAHAGALASATVELEDFPDDMVLQTALKEEPAPLGEERLVLDVAFEGAAVDSPWLEVLLIPDDAGSVRKRVVPVKLGSAVIEGIAPGVYDVQVNGYGYAPLALNGVRIPRQQALSVSLEIAPFVYGTIVVHGEGKPRFVDVSDLDGRRLRHVPVGSAGEIVIPGLRKGYYLFSSSDTGRTTHETPRKVYIEPEEHVVVELLEVDDNKEENITG